MRLIFTLVLSTGLFATCWGKPIELWISSRADVDYYEKMAKMYREKVDKDFEANVHAYGFTEMPDKLAIAIKTGINPPDIVQLDEIFFSIYLRGTVPFVDLTSRIAAAKLDEVILPQRMGLYTWKGKIYGVPQSVSGIVLYYREDLIKTVGISPKSMDTWPKFEAVAEELKKRGSQTMLALDWSYFEILLRQRGYELFDSTGKPFPDSAIEVETLQKLVDWKNRGIGLIDDRGSIFEPEFFNSYVQVNGVLAVLGAEWYGLDMIQNFDPKHLGKWRAMALPVWTDVKSKGQNPTSSFSGQGLQIFKSSKQVDKSWNFIKWVMTDVDANVDRYVDGNSLSANKTTWGDLRMSKPEPYFGNQILSDLLIQLAPSVPYVIQSPYRAQFVQLFREKYWNALMRGQITPEQALREIKAGMMEGPKKPETGPK